MSFKIAIDGPVAAGKSTVARKISQNTGFVYADTGAMYRAITLKAIREGVESRSEERLMKLVAETEIDVRPPGKNEMDGRLSTVLLDGEDVSWEIREPKVSRVVAKIASLPRVREVLVVKQRKVAENRDVVMEGRDITYVVLPEADLKIFLTAKEDVRIERYYKKLKAEDESLTKEEAAEILRKRDELDRTRETSPLKIVDDAWVLDTSELNPEEVVEKVVLKVKEIKA